MTTLFRHKSQNNKKGWDFSRPTCYIVATEIVYRLFRHSFFLLFGRLSGRPTVGFFGGIVLFLFCICICICLLPEWRINIFSTMCAIRPTSAHRAGDTPPILLQYCKFYCSCNSFCCKLHATCKKLHCCKLHVACVIAVVIGVLALSLTVSEIWPVLQWISCPTPFIQLKFENVPLALDS